jgi:hypothetical protein
MEQARSSRNTKRLSESLQKRLNSYAIMASAAGVGMLALAQPAEAKIIYKHAHIPINNNSGPVELDMNYDGTNDFKFAATYFSTGQRPSPLLGCCQAGLFASPAQQANRIDAVESNSRWLCAAALPKGVRVGPKSPFQPGESQLAMANAFSSTSYGPWRHGGEAYLGLEFGIKGKVHFGWARVNMTGNHFAAVITGYAYETVANKAIITGKTKGADAVEAGGLGDLAFGRR